MLSPFGGEHMLKTEEALSCTESSPKVLFVIHKLGQSSFSNSWCNCMYNCVWRNSCKVSTTFSFFGQILEGAACRFSVKTASLTSITVRALELGEISIPQRLYSSRPH